MGVRGGDIKNRYMYTGREYDSESGLYYYRARYYDAFIGRFVQKDPWFDAWKKGEGLYLYVGNNPVTAGDPIRLVTFQWLKYRVCYWWWGWHCYDVIYGWRVKFTAFETGLIAAGAGAAAIIAGVVPGGKIASIILGIVAFAAGLCSTYGLGLVITCAHGLVYYWCES